MLNWISIQFGNVELIYLLFSQAISKNSNQENHSHYQNPYVLWQLWIPCMIICPRCSKLWIWKIKIQQSFIFLRFHLYNYYFWKWILIIKYWHNYITAKWKLNATIGDPVFLHSKFELKSIDLNVKFYFYPHWGLLRIKSKQKFSMTSKLFIIYYYTLLNLLIIIVFWNKKKS